jgi:hypothetical protein
MSGGFAARLEAHHDRHAPHELNKQPDPLDFPLLLPPGARRWMARGRFSRLPQTLRDRVIALLFSSGVKSTPLPRELTLLVAFHLVSAHWNDVTRALGRIDAKLADVDAAKTGDSVAPAVRNVACVRSRPLFASPASSAIRPARGSDPVGNRSLSPKIVFPRLSAARALEETTSCDTAAAKSQSSTASAAASLAPVLPVSSCVVDRPVRDSGWVSRSQHMFCSVASENTSSHEEEGPMELECVVGGEFMEAWHLQAAIGLSGLAGDRIVVVVGAQGQSAGSGLATSVARLRSFSVRPADRALAQPNPQFEVKAVVRGCDSLAGDGAGMLFVPDLVMQRVLCVTEARGDIVRVLEDVERPHAIAFDGMAGDVLVVSEEEQGSHYFHANDPENSGTAKFSILRQGFEAGSGWLPALPTSSKEIPDLLQSDPILGERLLNPFFVEGSGRVLRTIVDHEGHLVLLSKHKQTVHGTTPRLAVTVLLDGVIVEHWVGKNLVLSDLAFDALRCIVVAGVVGADVLLELGVW